MEEFPPLPSGVDHCRKLREIFPNIQVKNSPIFRWNIPPYSGEIQYSSIFRWIFHNIQVKYFPIFRWNICQYSCKIFSHIQVKYSPILREIFPIIQVKYSLIFSWKILRTFSMCQMLSKVYRSVLCPSGTDSVLFLDPTNWFRRILSSKKILKIVNFCTWTH